MSNEKLDEMKRLLLQSNMQMEQAHQFDAEHSHAFRVAFDYLHRCFPPSRDEAYWSAAVQLMVKWAERDRQNPLVRILLQGVYDYLGEIVKDLPAEDEDKEENGDGNQDA